MHKKISILILPILFSTVMGAFWFLTVEAAPTQNVLGGGIVINEILPDPSPPEDANGNVIGDGFDTDRSGDIKRTDEFVELYNLSPNTIDISGWQLWDRGDGLWYTFTQGTQLASNAYAVVVMRVDVVEGGVLPDTAGTTNKAFNADHGRVFGNEGDNVVLLNTSNNEYIQIKYTGPITPGLVEETHDPVMLSQTLDEEGDPLGYEGFPPDARRVGVLEDWGRSEAGTSLARQFGGDTEIVLHYDVDELDDTVDEERLASPGARNVLAIALQSASARPSELTQLTLIWSVALAAITGWMWRKRPQIVRQK